MRFTGHPIRTEAIKTGIHVHADFLFTFLFQDAVTRPAVTFNKSKRAKKSEDGLTCESDFEQVERVQNQRRRDATRDAGQQVFVTDLRQN